MATVNTQNDAKLTTTATDSFTALNVLHTTASSALTVAVSMKPAHPRKTNQLKNATEPHELGRPPYKLERRREAESLSGSERSNVASATQTSVAKSRPMEDESFSAEVQNDLTKGHTIPWASQPPRVNLYPHEVIVAPEVAFPRTHRTPYAPPEEGSFHKVPSPPMVLVGTAEVRVEEIGLVLVVLMLWAGAITLFINRWGKLRMLEPYQPAYTAPTVPPPRPPPPQVGPCINIQSTSELALAEGGLLSGRYEWGMPESYGRGSLASGYLGMSRSPSSLSVHQLDPTRKVKSAVDLVSLVMQEKMSSNFHIATNV